MGPGARFGATGGEGSSLSGLPARTGTKGGVGAPSRLIFWPVELNINTKSVPFCRSLARIDKFWRVICRNNAAYMKGNGDGRGHDSKRRIRRVGAAQLVDPRAANSDQIIHGMEQVFATEGR